MSIVENQRSFERRIASYAALRPGPSLICIGGLHGNETAGIIAAQRVVARLEKERPAAFRGRLVSLAGNLTALNEASPPRYITSDLNREFSVERIRVAEQTPHAERTVEQREALELLACLEEEFDASGGPVAVVDLHTVSAKSVPFLVLEDSLAARRFAQNFQMPLILGVEEELEGLLFDYVGAQYGHVAIVIEGGEHDSLESIEAHEAAIWIALDASGILPLFELAHGESPAARLRAMAGKHAGRCYDVHHKQSVMDASFACLTKLEAFDRIRANTAIAVERGHQVLAPISGRLFMPNRQTRKRIGDDGFFIIRRVHWIWMALSASLRKSRLAHGLFRRLPGVAPDSKHPHRVSLDPSIAAVLKREILHLLGYRLVQHGPDVHWPLVKRLAVVALRLLRGSLRWSLSLFSGKSGPDVERELEDHWVAERRQLDLKPPRPF